MTCLSTQTATQYTKYSNASNNACMCTANDATGMPASMRRHMENQFVGHWVTTASFNGEKYQGELAAEWPPGKHCLIVAEKWTAPRADLWGSGIVHWDPWSRTVEYYGFFSTGDHVSIRWSEIDEQKWAGEVSGDFQGQKISSPAVVLWKGYSIEFRAMILGKPFVLKAVRSWSTGGIPNA